MRKRMSVATPMRAGTLVVYVVSAVICSLTPGCSTFILTRTYHDAATERSVSTPIRAASVTAARLRPDGRLTVAFSGWNCSRNMEHGTEKDYEVVVQTRLPPQVAEPSTAAPSKKQLETIRVLVFDKTDVEKPSTPSPGAIPVQVHIVDLRELRSTTWMDFAKKQVGPGVWVRKDRLEILYIPAPEHADAVPSVLARWDGEYARTFPALIYGYPVAIPVLVALDIATLPIKAVVFVVFLGTWDGSMF